MYRRAVLSAPLAFGVLRERPGDEFAALRGVSRTMQPIRTDNLAKLYDMPDMEWARAEAALGEGSVGREPAAFLGTVGRDGRPHVAGVGIVVHDGSPFFCAGLGTGKARNLMHNPACTLALRLEGLDLSLEGEARRVDDPELRGAPSRRCTPRVGGRRPLTSRRWRWPRRTRPSRAGPGPWPLWRFTINKAVGVATAEPHGASRWTFAG